MVNLQGISSSFSYTSPSYVSDGFTETACQNLSSSNIRGGAADPLPATSDAAPATSNLDIVSLSRLSGNLESTASATSIVVGTLSSIGMDDYCLHREQGMRS